MKLQEFFAAVTTGDIFRPKNSGKLHGELCQDEIARVMAT